MTPNEQSRAPRQPPEREEEADTSPESAAVVRGAARTAASSGTRSAAAATKGAIGRLPSTASRTVAKASKAMGRAPRVAARPRVVARGAPRNIPKAAAPKNISLPRAPRVGAPRGAPRSAPKLPSRIPKARANTIARASDRASKGMDVLSAGFEQTSDPNAQGDAKGNLQTKRSAQLRKARQQIASFGRIFFTNTLLGMAVFGTYEGIIEHVSPSINGSGATEEDVVNTFASSDDACKDSEPQHMQGLDAGEYTDAMDQATLPQHFFAGAMGGASHAVLSLALEVKVNASRSDALPGSAKESNYTVANPIGHPKAHLQIRVPTMNYATASILHHSVAHSVLFGSYQWTKRLLLQHARSDSTSDAASGHNDGQHVASIAVAGGLAGQLQHVASHFTEQMLGLSEESTSSSSTLLRRLKLASWPTWRSTMLAFPPSAIGFLAFEYGKLMVGDN